ncbi:MAG: hypothetical protein AABX17_01430 [Nanoarchaeota archaeon]
MLDLQTTAGVIDLTIKVLTIILLIIAFSLAIRKKNNLAFAVAVLGNLGVYYFTESPLLCWIVSVACIIWISSTKSKEPDSKSNLGSKLNKQSLKSSNAHVNNKKMVKPGPIIGLILGILMAGFPIIGFMIGEASLADSQGKMIGYGFIAFGVFMIVVNIIVLATGKENLLAGENDAKTESAPIPIARVKTEDDSSAKFSQNVRCRFCKKTYSAEYNGCPYCKKK